VFVFVCVSVCERGGEKVCEVEKELEKERNVENERVKVCERKKKKNCVRECV